PGAKQRERHPIQRLGDRARDSIGSGLDEFHQRRTTARDLLHLGPIHLLVRLLTRNHHESPRSTTRTCSASNDFLLAASTASCRVSYARQSAHDMTGKAAPS